MSVKEEDVGITAFTDDLPGFSAVLKHRAHDFLVNEIATDGKVVRLTGLTPDAPLDRQESQDTPSSSIFSMLTELIGEEAAQKLLSFSDASAQPIEIGPVEDKQTRTEIHRLCKADIPGLPPLATEAVKRDGSTFIRIVPRSKAKKMLGWQNRKREQKDRDGRRDCRYVRFVLYKENTDNQIALNLLSKQLKIPPTVFRIAGTKDKRGITTQLVAAQNVSPRRLAQVNQKLRYIKVGNFVPSKENLYVGDLMGNQFRIVLRDVVGATGDQVTAACQSLKFNGFVNYFGLQRFGQGTPTHSIGCALLKGDWETAARLILRSSPVDDERTAAAKEHYLKGEIEKALDVLPKRAFSERALLEGYRDLGPTQHLPCINRIGRNTRTLYAHAYQSYIWNHVVSERIRLYGPTNVLEGDLVLEREASTRKTSTERIADVRYVTADDIAHQRYGIEDVVLPLPGGSMQYPKNDTESIYHRLTERDDISLTVCSHKVKEFSIEKLSGDYRHMIASVKDLEHELVPYTNPDAALLTTDLDVLLKFGQGDGDLEGEADEKPEAEMGSSEGRQNHEGDLMEDPLPRTEIEASKEPSGTSFTTDAVPRQPNTQNTSHPQESDTIIKDDADHEDKADDADKTGDSIMDTAPDGDASLVPIGPRPPSGRGLKRKPSQSVGLVRSVGSCRSVEDPDCIDHGPDHHGSPKRPKIDPDAPRLALKLSFTLPSSSYATMVVRQLTKSSTAKSDQIAYDRE